MKFIYTYFYTYNYDLSTIKLDSINCLAILIALSKDSVAGQITEYNNSGSFVNALAFPPRKDATGFIHKRAENDELTRC